MKEFLSRPEHAAMLEKQQQKEFKQAMQLKEKIRALEFRNKARLGFGTSNRQRCIAGSVALRPCCALQVLESDYDAQKNVAPFLKSKMLRRIVQASPWLRCALIRWHVEPMCATHPLPQTFTNDESGDFEKWANNPRVVEMLREAQRQLDEG